MRFHFPAVGDPAGGTGYCLVRSCLSGTEWEGCHTLLRSGKFAEG